MTTYDPIVLRDGMNAQGYRFVTISVAPGRRITVTVCREGSTRDDAIASALLMIQSMPNVSKVRH
jgi:hypothetical protein